MTGWIRLHRKFMDHWLYRENRAFTKKEAWIDLLLLANHDDNKILMDNEVVMINRGQRITSIRYLCDRWKWSNTKVRNFLTLLENEKMIEIRSDTKKTVITIVNYDFYQSNDSRKKTQESHDSNKVATNEHTNNNDKNGNNDKNEEIPYRKIVDYLNNSVDKRFKYTSKKTKQLIRARWKEGYRYEDFIKVIDNKTKDWKNSIQFSSYLRPETLFGQKFESYLNQKGETNNDQSQYDQYEF